MEQFAKSGVTLHRYFPLIHGSGGLIDVYKSFATDFAWDGFFAAALDLYDGQTVGDEAMRLRLQNSVRSDPAKALETISTWLARQSLRLRASMHVLLGRPQVLRRYQLANLFAHTQRQADPAALISDRLWWAAEIMA